MIRWAVPVFISTVASIGLADPGAIPGYTNHAALVDRLHKLEASPLVTIKSLAKTREGRDLSLVTIGSEDRAKETRDPGHGKCRRSAHRRIGNSPRNGRMAGESLIERTDQKLSDAHTIYVIPRPNPDGTERFFTSPRHEVDGNAQPTDDDRDFSTGEDPPNDLNYDGLITVTRIEDPTGNQIVHPEDPRIMISADPQKGKKEIIASSWKEQIKTETSSGTKTGATEFPSTGIGPPSIPTLGWDQVRTRFRKQKHARSRTSVSIIPTLLPFWFSRPRTIFSIPGRQALREDQDQGSRRRCTLLRTLGEEVSRDSRRQGTTTLPRGSRILF